MEYEMVNLLHMENPKVDLPATETEKLVFPSADEMLIILPPMEDNETILPATESEKMTTLAQEMDILPPMEDSAEVIPPDTETEKAVPSKITGDDVVKLKGSDGTVFEVKKPVADMISDVLVGYEACQIPAPAMAKLIEYTTKRVDIAGSDPAVEKIDALIKTWDDNFHNRLNDHLAEQSRAIAKLKTCVGEAYEKVLNLIREMNSTEGTLTTM